MQLPYIPSDVPFTGDQKAWLAGFLAGLNTKIAMAGSATAQPIGAVQAAAPTGIALQVVFGSQTGTAEYLAEQLVEQAGAQGFVPVLRSRRPRTRRPDCGATTGGDHLHLRRGRHARQR